MPRGQDSACLPCLPRPSPRHEWSERKFAEEVAQKVTRQPPSYPPPFRPRSPCCEKCKAASKELVEKDKQLKEFVDQFKSEQDMIERMEAVIKEKDERIQSLKDSWGDLSFKFENLRVEHNHTSRTLEYTQERNLEEESEPLHVEVRLHEGETGLSAEECREELRKIWSFLRTLETRLSSKSSTTEVTTKKIKMSEDLVRSKTIKEVLNILLKGKASREAFEAQEKEIKVVNSKAKKADALAERRNKQLKDFTEENRELRLHIIRLRKELDSVKDAESEAVSRNYELDDRFTEGTAALKCELDEKTEELTTAQEEIQKQHELINDLKVNLHELKEQNDEYLAESHRYHSIVRENGLCVCSDAKPAKLLLQKEKREYERQVSESKEKTKMLNEKLFRADLQYKISRKGYEERVTQLTMDLETAQKKCKDHRTSLQDQHDLETLDLEKQFQSDLRAKQNRVNALVQERCLLQKELKEVKDKLALIVNKDKESNDLVLKFAQRQADLQKQVDALQDEQAEQRKQSLEHAEEMKKKVVRIRQLEEEAKQNAEERIRLAYRPETRSGGTQTKAPMTIRNVQTQACDQSPLTQEVWTQATIPRPGRTVSTQTDPLRSPRPTLTQQPLPPPPQHIQQMTLPPRPAAPPPPPITSYPITYSQVAKPFQARKCTKSVVNIGLRHGETIERLIKDRQMSPKAAVNGMLVSRIPRDSQLPILVSAQEITEYSMERPTKRHGSDDVFLANRPFVNHRPTTRGFVSQLPCFGHFRARGSPLSPARPDQQTIKLPSRQARPSGSSVMHQKRNLTSVRARRMPSVRHQKRSVPSVRHQKPSVSCGGVAARKASHPVAPKKPWR
ncbi:calponin homology domain-containing protein DDB_G0272472-like [Sycon ciliatum]|uniref:calponin homology domain-containing protein DDB_G0272472-like n=1 Tax=Sycon ciliatum TaxID=27933 RepID=UPI0031F609BB